MNIRIDKYGDNYTAYYANTGYNRAISNAPTEYGQGETMFEAIRDLMFTYPVDGGME